MNTVHHQLKLPLGELIEYRIRAKNLAGIGPWSEVNMEGATVRTKPGTMNRPKKSRDSTSKQIIIEWEPSVWTEKTGGSKILGYILQEDGQTIYSGKRTHSTFNPRQSVNKIYRFRVASWNIYGLGKFSDELKVRVGSRKSDLLDL